jgi:hypothetical protein
MGVRSCQHSLSLIASVDLLDDPLFRLGVEVTELFVHAIAVHVVGIADNGNEPHAVMSFRLKGEDKGVTVV